MKYPILYLLFTAICYTSCREATSQSKSLSITNQATDTLQFNSVSLFTIDASIYSAMDTTWDFADGTAAYQYAFGGGAFIDSLGRPIHNRYKSYKLTLQQVARLKQEFSTQLSDNQRSACTPMYRDVLVFFDTVGKATGQAQICFGCSTIAVYPTAKFQHNKERVLDYTAFKAFINSIKGN